MSVDDENEFKNEIGLWQKGISRELHEIQPPKELDQFVSDLPQMVSAQKARKNTFVGIAAIILAGVVVPLFYSAIVNKGKVQKPSAMIGDLNGDDQINMVDAFLLHKKLQEEPSFASDLNGDGVTDQLDVTWLAEISVKAGLL